MSARRPPSPRGARPAVPVLVILLLGPLVPAKAQTFTRLYGTPVLPERGTSVDTTPDGGYVVAGFDNPGLYDYHLIVMRLDNAAQVAWVRKLYALPIGVYGIPPAEPVVRTTPDGGFVVTSTAYGSDATWNVLVARLDGGGSILWQREYAGPSDDGSFAIEPTSDLGYVVVGWSEPAPVTYPRLLVLKLDAAGSVTWGKRYETAALWGDIAYGVDQTADGGYLIAGTSDYGGNRDALVLRLDTLGNPVWERRLGTGSGQEALQSVVETQDGGVLAGGSSSSFGAGSADGWVVRLDAAGAVTWQKVVGTADDDGFLAVREVSSGAFVASGRIPGWGNWPNTWVVALSSAGALSWQKRYLRAASSTSGEGEDIVETADGGLAVASFEYSGNSDDVFVIKTDEDGVVTAGCVGVSDTTASVADATGVASLAGTLTDAGLIALPRADVPEEPPFVVEEACADWSVFSIIASPSSLNVDRGSSAGSSVALTSFDWSGSVTLSCEGLPAGAGCGFAPPVVPLAVQSAGASAMTLSVSGATAPGVHPFELVGTSGALVRRFGMLLVVPSLDAEPNPRAFGSVELGSSSTLPVVVTNAAGYAVTVASVSSPALPFTIAGNGCTGQVLPPLGTCTVQVAFAPTAPGPAASSFRVATSGGEHVDVALSGTGVTPPVVPTVVTPDGGERWVYSPSAATRRSHLVAWNVSSYFPVTRTRLSYTTDGTTWSCVADSSLGSCGSGCCNQNLTGSDTLLPEDQNFLWDMPTEAEAASAGQAFPSSSALARVEIWDGSGGAGADASDATFYVVQPTTASVRTLLLWHPGRIDAAYPGTSAMLGAKLAQLASHAAVAGVVLDLSGVPAIQAAYAAWDASPGDQALANAVAAQVRSFVVAQATGAYTNALYVILVGDDAQVPFHRIPDGTTIYPESAYPAEVGLSTATTVGAAIASGHILTDAYYGELSPEPTGLPAPHHLLYLNDLATGRLVETPAQMAALVDTFLAQDGQVELLDPADDVLVTGFDFLHDAALSVTGKYAAAGESTVCLLDDPDAGGTTDPCVDKPYGPGDLEARLFAPVPPRLGNVNTHANHHTWATPLGSLSTVAMAANPGALTGSALYSSGCHSGLPVPVADPNALDLPELMASKGVVAYVGNTGYGWGLKQGKGLTERLVELMTDEILATGSISLGQALARAKRTYHGQERRYDVFDEKVLHELTLFGIPSYLVVSRVATGPGRGAAELPRPADPVNRACVEGICLQKRLGSPGEGAAPPGVTELELNFSFGAGTYSLVSTPDGGYYRLNGLSSGEAGDAIQPHFVYNSTLAGTRAKGVVFTSGSFTPVASFDPVVGVPRSTNPDGGEGPLPLMRISTPNMSFSTGTPLSGDPGKTNMVVHTGVYEQASQRQDLFDDMQFVVYYSNAADQAAPVIADPGPSGFHALSGLDAAFTVSVGDASGVYRVLVTYSEAGSNAWKLVDLARDAGSGSWIGSVTFKASATYFVSAVDNAGNVGVLSISGPDQGGGGQPYGSTWSGPRTFDVVLADGDGDGLPDAYEDQHPCLDRLVADGGLDPDLDYLTSLQELEAGTGPCQADTDGGGDNDGSERSHGRDPVSPSDDLPLTILVAKNGADYDVSWPAGVGQNALIDGYYHVYRSSTPHVDPGDRIAGPLPDGSTAHTDVAPPCDPCYYRVWNAALTTPPPTVDVVLPWSGPAAGGTPVSIYGNDFVPGAVVRFDGAAAGNVVVVSGNKITCTTPAGAAGPADVVVTNPNGQDGSLAGGFTYVP